MVNGGTENSACIQTSAGQGERCRWCRLALSSENYSSFRRELVPRMVDWWHRKRSSLWRMAVGDMRVSKKDGPKCRSNCFYPVYPWHWTSMLDSVLSNPAVYYRCGLPICPPLLGRWSSLWFSQRNVHYPGLRYGTQYTDCNTSSCRHNAFRWYTSSRSAEDSPSMHVKSCLINENTILGEINIMHWSHSSIFSFRNFITRSAFLAAGNFSSFFRVILHFFLPNVYVTPKLI